MNLPLELLLFYGSSFTLYMSLLKRKRTWLFSLLVSLLIVLVSSEFWEIPIFVSGALGIAYWWPYPSIAFLLHHVNIVILFIILIYVAKIQLRISSPFWLFGLIINTMLLLTYRLMPIYNWQARIAGTFFFGLGVYFGSSILGFKS